MFKNVLRASGISCIWPIFTYLFFYFSISQHMTQCNIYSASPFNFVLYTQQLEFFMYTEITCTIFRDSLTTCVQNLFGDPNANLPNQPILVIYGREIKRKKSIKRRLYHLLHITSILSQLNANTTHIHFLFNNSTRG